MLCNNCGRQNAEGAQFCGFCGAQLGAPGQYPPGAYPQRQGGGDKSVIVIVLVVVGLGFLFVFGILAAIMFPVFAKARTKAQQASCMSNVKQLCIATLMYSQDYDQVFPRAANWCDSLMPYTKNTGIYVCPALQTERNGYAYNGNLSGVSLTRIMAPNEVPAVFDAKGGWNGYGGKNLVEPRHAGMATVGFVDGHVRALDEGSVGGARWGP